MKFVKLVMLVLALCMPMASFALTSDEQVEYTEALESGNVNTVQKFLKDKLVDVNDKFFAWSALQIAANKNQLGVVKVLVENGADINYKHPITKMTALHLAAFDGFEDITKYLISKGADLTIKMRGGVSIVRAVHDQGNTKMEELLLAAGAKDDGCKEEKCF